VCRGVPQVGGGVVGLSVSQGVSNWVSV